MKKYIFYFILFAFPFHLWSQNYYVPTNFSSLNISKKGDHSFSISDDILQKNRHLTCIYSLSPFQNIYANVGGLLHWNPSLDNGLERISMLNFSVGGYYFFPFKKNKKRRRRKRKRKKFIKKARKMDYGVLTSIGLGYSFGKTKEIFDRGSGSFYFNKWNAQFRLQIQTPHWGIGYFGKIGTLTYHKVRLLGHIEPWVIEASDNLEKTNHFLLWESSIRLYFGNHYGQIYFDKVTLHTNKRIAQDIGRANLQTGVNIYLSKIFTRK